MDVLATCLRQCRTEFRIAENSKENGNATGEPEGDDAPCRTQVTSHLAGNEENPRANRSADHHRSSGPYAKSTYQIWRHFLGCFRHFMNLGEWDEPTL